MGGIGGQVGSVEPSAVATDSKSAVAEQATKWKTVCNGHHYWTAFQKVPRKCTQSKVKMSECGTKVLKEHMSDSWYRKEKRMLEKLSSDEKTQGLVPKLVAFDNGRKQLVLSNCGNPIRPKQIPDACRNQVCFCDWHNI
jgi:hypothetical protein